VVSARIVHRRGAEVAEKNLKSTPQRRKGRKEKGIAVKNNRITPAFTITRAGLLT
jgi:hypothetical protein